MGRERLKKGEDVGDQGARGAAPEDPVLLRWVRLLDRQEMAEAPSVLAQDVTIFASQEGRGGPVTLLDGLERVSAWIDKAPAERFGYELVAWRPAPPRPELPAADRTVWARYRVFQRDGGSDFENWGEWHLAIAGGRVVGVAHEPDPLDACSV